MENLVVSFFFHFVLFLWFLELLPNILWSVHIYLKILPESQKYFIAIISVTGLIHVAMHIEDDVWKRLMKLFFCKISFQKVFFQSISKWNFRLQNLRIPFRIDRLSQLSDVVFFVTLLIFILNINQINLRKHVYWQRDWANFSNSVLVLKNTLLCNILSS